MYFSLYEKRIKKKIQWYELFLESKESLIYAIVGSKILPAFDFLVLVYIQISDI